MDPREAAIRTAFAQQAVWCSQLGSPLTGALCTILSEQLDRSTATGRRILDWDGDPLADALMLRPIGGLHALVRSGQLPGLATHYPPHQLPDMTILSAAVMAAIREADEALLPWLASPPQTNEVARSGVLMPGLLVIADATGLPLALHELGSSAGLNLRLDHYAYELGGLVIGPGLAPITLSPEWHGAPPPDARVRVTSRKGVDQNPLDICDQQTRDRLLAYVWPDQPERLQRLESALTAAAMDPPVIDRADAADWVEQQVWPAAGVVTVVFHSIAFQYFPMAARARIAAHMRRVGQEATVDAPVAWLRFELDDPEQIGPPPTLRLQIWPGGEDRLLARVHPHGALVHWLG